MPRSHAPQPSLTYPGCTRRCSVPPLRRRATAWAWVGPRACVYVLTGSGLTGTWKGLRQTRRPHWWRSSRRPRTPGTRYGQRLVCGHRQRGRGCSRCSSFRPHRIRSRGQITSLDKLRRRCTLEAIKRFLCVLAPPPLPRRPSRAAPSGRIHQANAPVRGLRKAWGRALCVAAGRAPPSRRQSASRWPTTSLRSTAWAFRWVRRAAARFALSVRDLTLAGLSEPGERDAGACRHGPCSQRTPARRRLFALGGARAGGCI